MTGADTAACGRACASTVAEDAIQAMNGARAHTAQHSAQELLERLAALTSEMARTLGDLAKHAEIRLAAGANKSVSADVNSRSTTPAKMLTAATLGDLLCVDEKTIRRWRSDRLLPPGITIGGVVRWHPAVVDRWLRGGGQ